MTKIKLGYCFCGSFCTFKQNIEIMRELSKKYDIQPIMSFNAASINTRFGKAADFIAEMESICKKPVIRTIEDAEPIGPTHMTDIMLVSPCTGNTLAKLANSITDTPVTMAVKSHLRNHLPVVLAVSSNDALSGSAKNIGILQSLKYMYFVPMGQDNHKIKPCSLVARFCDIEKTLEAAQNGKQIEPMILGPYLNEE
ncbi:dipicolinate synthase subunit B [Paludicola sp. MB14-C6]|uniref:dipicolinate synthase subunit B n=1 Tax=Paludihabitans sp. MB14-C6 TaxID=3070656 RepID=UPI0027DC0D66|nr:dipicolinate synthase subunit B [Paludicola sp. MB14-C6]WMJ24221.1 dipicolinate synthase subunit B [Paludicola sp. MB14-C6]